MKFLRVMMLFCLCTLLLIGPYAATADTAGASPLPQQISLIILEKSKRLMTVFNTDHIAIRTYEIALGSNPVGNKTESGDGKTPEGAYIIDGRNENSAYNLSLHISYPNEQDILNAEHRGVTPGGGIFIHGKPNGREWMWWKYRTGRDWTHGCIAVSNHDIEELWDLIPDGTPIIIRP